MKEFAQKGFKNASTDTITKEASISKGALFYYFNNKKDLFLFLYDYSVDLIMKEVLGKFKAEEKDIFERIRHATLLKLEIFQKYNNLYDFIFTAYAEDSTEVKNEMEQKKYGLLAVGMAKMYDGIDISRFKEDIESKRAIEIITWSVEGFSKMVMGKVNNYSMLEVNFKQVFNELDVYLQMLKKSFYK